MRNVSFYNHASKLTCVLEIIFSHLTVRVDIETIIQYILRKAF